MSVWRHKAIEIAPELKNCFQDPDLSPYTAFSELLYLLEQAHLNKDILRIQKIYDYAEWCFRQKDQKLWNSAGVSFYEHLGDNEVVFSQFTNWIKKDIYKDIRSLLDQRLDNEKMKYLDKYYGFTKPKKAK
jgi:hypothetical protein